MKKRTERDDLKAILSELRKIRRATEESLPRTHVYPLAEHDHILRGKRCWCSPGVAIADDATTEIIYHRRAQ